MIPAPPNSALLTVQGGDIYTTADQLPMLYCVYIHSDATERVVYVGMCKLSEVYNATDARANSEWFKTIGKETFNIRIAAVSPNPADCINKRFHLIQQYQPHCNIRGLDLAGNTGAQAIVCNETGERFPSITAAAMAHNASQSAISNHLAKRRHYDRVKGRTYRREIV